MSYHGNGNFYIMTDNLDRALNASNFLVNLANTRDHIHLKMLTMLQYSHNGGIFQINQELITFIKMILDTNYKTVVILDKHNNPIEISDIKQFFDEIFDRYFQATNYYHSEYKKLKELQSSIDILSFFKD